jgi:CDC6/ORC-like protein
MVRINFQPYTTTQLERIVHARLGRSTEVLSKDAVKFAAMKVSSISGDARRVLDIAGTCTSPSPHHPLHILPLFTTGYDVLRKANADGQWNSYNLPDA